MNVLDAMAARRSIRVFRNKMPSRAMVESILRNAGMAPSQRNIQPWRVRIYAKRELMHVIDTATAGEPPGQDGPSSAGVASGGGVADSDRARSEGLRFYGAPLGMLCTIRRTASVEEWLDHGAFIYGLGLAAVEFGLATCIIGHFSGLDERLSSVAGLNPNEERISVGVSMGFAQDEQVKAGNRKAVSDIAEFHWR